MRRIFLVIAGQLGLTCLAFAAGPLRVDLSAVTGRSDAETFRWQEWELGEEQSATVQWDGLQATVRSPGKPFSGFLHKASLAKGFSSLTADGIRCDGPLELVIEGLSSGEHSLATFHNWPPNSPTAELTVECAGQTAKVQPTVAAEHDDRCASAFLKLVAVSGQPVVVKIAAVDGKSPVVLNGFELNAPRPDAKAYRPAPLDFDEHVAGESGEVKLTWRGAPGAAKYRVVVAEDRDWNVAFAKASSARSSEAGAPAAEVTDTQFAMKVAPNDSLAHYCWRVDSVAADGAVTPGDVWSFRVRKLAFPGAEGYGRFAIGGRGGKVVKVTTLADAGPGSLRAALEERGAKTIVFEVSGRIDLKSRIGIRDDYITIAGQTAPGAGICISNYNLGMLGAHDVIVRYLRVRPGNTSGETLDGMGMASSDNSIIDHCSISWTHDESFSSRGAKNITLQRTLISEALNIAGHRKYEAGKQHGYAASIGGDIGSFHHNLLAHCAGRNWSLAGSIDQANVHMGRLDIRNNVVFNWSHRTTDGGAKQVQFVNNFYKPGPATKVFHLLKPERNYAFGPQDYFVAGNVMVGHHQASEPLSGVIEPPGESLSKFVYPQPFYESFVTTHSAEEAYEDVLADVGCNFPRLDPHDERVLSEVRSGDVKFKGSKSGLPGLPDSQDDVGGWDEYPEEHRPADWDPDNDGIPSVWETSHGLDPASPADGPQDADGDGETNLEEYLNGVVTAASEPEGISAAEMQQVYEELKTPIKHGLVLVPPKGEMYDCPTIFRHHNKWWMVFVSIKDKIGYETRLAESSDLLTWKIVGTILPMGQSGWDQWQADGGIALFDTTWGGSNALAQHDGKYWLSYFGGAKQGYETDPLSIGMAWTTDPTSPQPWTRLAENPVLSPSDESARQFEGKTLYKSFVFQDPAKTLGQPFVMFYNGKQAGAWIERIGVAVSSDLKSWTRHGAEPVISNEPLKPGGASISGDPQLIRIKDLWVMAYFGAGWQKQSFDTFAVSRDLVHWTKWTGPNLIEPSEPFDETYAHKPWFIKQAGVVYHFYCAVGDAGRAIALATSRELMDLTKNSAGGR